MPRRGPDAGRPPHVPDGTVHNPPIPVPPPMLRLKHLFLAVPLLLLAACADGDRLTRPGGARLETLEMDEVETDTTLAPPARPTAFLPPMAPAAPRQGAFDPALKPVVAICRAADAECAQPVARFTTTAGSGSETVRVDAAGSQYIVNWHTGRFGVAPGEAYRVRVTVGGTETASRTVRIVASPGQAPAGETAVVNGRTLPIKFWIAKVRRLSVFADAGVAGTPAEQDSMYAYGADVPYAFQAAPGYHNLQVTLDGRPAPASGVLHMDADHALTAAAEVHVTVPSGGEDLLSSARAILTAHDKPAAFQHHLNLVGALYDAMEMEQASARLDSVYRLAWDAVQDSAAIRQAHEALANRTFAIERAAPAALRFGPARMSVAAADAPAGTTFMTVNGIFNGPGGAAKYMAEAEKSARNAGVMKEGDVFRLYYNSSFLNSDEVPQRLMRCFENALADHRFIGYVLLVPRLLWCVAEAAYKGILSFDIFEAAGQALHMAGVFPIKSARDARILGDTMQAQLRRGERVVYVPHSQGNLMVQEALLYNRQNAPDLQSRLCIGVVSLASPESGHFLLRPGLEQGMYVRDDIILLLPFTQNYPQIETDKSAAAARTWGRWYWRWLGVSRVVQVIERIGLHSSTDSYLGARQSRDWITGTLRIERAVLAGMAECRAPVTDSVEVTPPQATLGLNQTAQLTATARDTAGNVITGRPVAWSSSNPAAVSVSSQGVVRGMSEGTATVTATVEGVSGTAAVRVSADVSSVEVSPASVTLAPGQTRALSATARDEEGRVLTGRAVEWSILDPAVASVSGGGVVTGVAEGTAEVWATVDGVIGVATVRVSAPPPVAGPDSVLPIGASGSWTITPSASERVTVSFDARIDYPSTAGNSTVLEITVNGTPVTSSALINKAASFTYVNRGGTEAYSGSRGSPVPLWGVFWSPDFAQNNSSSDFYYVEGERAYEYVLDVTSLVRAGEVNTITFRNRAEFLQSIAPVIYLRGVRVEAQ
jgi:hypothetical protein